jgi:hypothetical protein
VDDLARQRAANRNPSEIGYGVYVSLGFVVAPPMAIWVPPGG